MNNNQFKRNMTVRGRFFRYISHKILLAEKWQHKAPVWWCKILFHMIAAEILAGYWASACQWPGTRLRGEHMLLSYWSPAGKEAFLLVAEWSDFEPCRWGLDTGKLIILIGVVSSKLAWARESGRVQARPALETAKSKTGSRSEGGRAVLTNWLGSQPCWKMKKKISNISKDLQCVQGICVKLYKAESYVKCMIVYL